jgi:hypothetical protein
MKLRETGCYGMYFVQMARNRAQWWAIVKVINIPLKMEKFLDQLHDPQLLKDYTPQR